MDGVMDVAGSPMAKDRLNLVLEQAGSLFQGLLANEMGGVYIIQDGVFRYVNQRFCDLFGYGADEICDRLGPRDLTAAEHVDLAVRAIEDRLEGRSKTGHYTFRAIRRDGTHFYAEVFGVQTEFCQRPAIIGIIVNVDAQIQAQNRLENDSRFISQLVETIPSPVFYKDENGVYLGCNKAFEDYLGREKQAIIGKSVFDLSPPHLAKVYHAADMDLLSRGGVQTYETRVSTAMGEERDVVFNKAVFSKADGQVGGLVGVIQDITLVKRAAEDVRQKKEAEEARQMAEAANQAKSEFLSNMSHELRTPLNAILGFAQLLLTNPKEPLSNRQNQQVSKILAGGEHLLKLITEILDLAKIEAGKLSLSIESLSLAAILDECAQFIAPEMDRYGVSLTLSPVPENCKIQADQVRTRQVVINLLSNAAKYNRPGGTVHMECLPLSASVLRLKIRDTGRGIPAHLMDELFLPFNRLGAETTEIEGTGVGLALSKSLMDSMGGQIGVESQLGQGSCFWLDFPLAQTDSDAKVHPSERDRPQQGGQSVMLDITVLYVEDNLANIALMESIMEMLDGVRLLTAPSAENALEMLTVQHPDLIIMDVNLPGISGIEATRQLKANPQTAGIPVLGLSADATPRTIEQGLMAGFMAYLSKPVDVPMLIQHIRQAIGLT